MKASVILLVLALNSGCVTRPHVFVGEEAVVGTFTATADLHAESRICLKRDHTYESYTLLWHRLRSTPAGEVPESIGYESGRWTLTGSVVHLTPTDGKSIKMHFAQDSGASVLVRGKFRFRMLYPEEPNKAPEPTPASVTPRATEGASE